MATRKPDKPINRGSSVAEEAIGRRHGRGGTGATRKTARRVANPETTTAVPEQHVRLRAYFLSLERDDGRADPVADWLRAEDELFAEATILSGVNRMTTKMSRTPQ